MDSLRSVVLTALCVAFNTCHGDAENGGAFQHMAEVDGHDLALDLHRDREHPVGALVLRHLLRRRPSCEHCCELTDSAHAAESLVPGRGEALCLCVQERNTVSAQN